MGVSHRIGARRAAKQQPTEQSTRQRHAAHPNLPGWMRAAARSQGTGCRRWQSPAPWWTGKQPPSGAAGNAGLLGLREWHSRHQVLQAVQESAGGAGRSGLQTASSWGTHAASNTRDQRRSPAPLTSLCGLATTARHHSLLPCPADACSHLARMRSWRLWHAASVPANKDPDPRPPAAAAGEVQHNNVTARQQAHSKHTVCQSASPACIRCLRGQVDAPEGRQARLAQRPTPPTTPSPIPTHRRAHLCPAAHAVSHAHGEATVADEVSILQARQK